MLSFISPIFALHSPLSARKRLAFLLPVFLLLFLAACNESSSRQLETSVMVVSGDMEVVGNNIKMEINLGKEGSHVVLVLEGGDTLKATDGSSEQYMDYSSDLFGSHYRAAFPLSLTAPYSVTLTRADGSNILSSFPALPNAFSLTMSPVNTQPITLSTTPSLDVAWSNLGSVSKLELDSSLSCSWNVSPLPPGNYGPLVNRESNDYHRGIDSNERSTQRVAVAVAAIVDLQRAELVLENPSSTVSLHACDAGFRIYARNFGVANPLLSRSSQMNTQRTEEISVRLLP